MNELREDGLDKLLSLAADKAIDTEVGKLVHLNELRLIIEKMGGDKDD